MTAALGLWWSLRRRESAGGRRLSALAVAAFAVATTALLVTAGGINAFVLRAQGAPENDYRHVYVALAALAGVLLIVPVTTLGGVAARLALSRRDARLSALRLTGATSGQVAVMTLAECATQAATGAVLGVAGYLAMLVPLTALSFQGSNLRVGELWLGVPILAAAVLAVVALAVCSGVMSLTRVVVGPLGVAARTTPARLHVARLVVTGVVLMVWILGFQMLGKAGIAVLLVTLAAAIGTVNVVGPWLVMVAGRVVARFAQRPDTLLAARRIVDDPRSTWRMVSALTLGILVATLSGVSATFEAGPQASRDDVLLGIDVGTGSLVALAIIAVVAATSTGVVQAARVLDQRTAYRALALAGAPLAFLHRARLKEVAIPLAVTLVLGGSMPLLLLLPLSAAVGPSVLGRAIVAIGVACALILASVTVSRGLVREAASA